jgi:hypothetical protein
LLRVEGIVREGGGQQQGHSRRQGQQVVQDRTGEAASMVHRPRGSQQHLLGSEVVGTVLQTAEGTYWRGWEPRAHVRIVTCDQVG